MSDRYIENDGRRPPPSKLAVFGHIWRVTRCYEYALIAIRFGMAGIFFAVSGLFLLIQGGRLYTVLGLVLLCLAILALIKVIRTILGKVSSVRRKLLAYGCKNCGGIMIQEESYREEKWSSKRDMDFCSVSEAGYFECPLCGRKINYVETSLDPYAFGYHSNNWARSITRTSKRLLTSAELTELSFNLGVKARSAGHFSLAEQCFYRALQLDPGFQQAEDALNDLRDSGDFQGSHGELKRIMDGDDLPTKGSSVSGETGR